MTADHQTDHQTDADRALLGVDAAAPEHLATLRRDLARRADADGLLDLAHRVVDTPIGPCLVVLAPTGIVRIAFEVEGHDEVLADLAALISPRILADSDRTDPAARQLDEYFAGTRHEFDLPVDLRLAHGFRRTVLDAMRLVPYGETVSYARLADAAGNPKAVRAAGSACASNPVPIVVPCHRIVRSDGTTGNYRGGPEAKVTLLALERFGA
jgi:methylated-DNA-[protein]-cysteine S-methyltransferase